MLHPQIFDAFLVFRDPSAWVGRDFKYLKYIYLVALSAECGERDRAFSLRMPVWLPAFASLFAILSINEKQLSIYEEMDMSVALLERQAMECPSETLAPGCILLDGEYAITELLSWGGFGITYLATDARDRVVIIKECYPRSFCGRDGLTVVPNDEASAAILDATLCVFLQDARSIAKVQHRNIAAVERIFEENATAYVVLEFIDGYDLLEVIEQSHARPDPDEVRDLLRKTLAALGKVHEAGLLHRDIAPENIIVTGANEPVLIDFGATLKTLARIAASPAELPNAKSAYTPLEFFVSGSKHDPAGDFYALAATFYHLITGELPADCRSRMSAHLGGKPDPYVPLSKLTDEFDTAFCNALDCALSLLPKDRVRSAEEWRRIL
ncbi:serine/threonine protein kinase [Marivita hallyeonensis]|uniref:non-specific serine/threonine protein kinase n=1 Tax=Marivita hallyeonensis TaxID=996342 RepID=A0A1M5LRL4_9RHOB|nr:serine/threonine-protein kinase [Marivita hallyeonensis]SHG67688.1 Serine/threonine protein kinase [Marivita hallyeonensis]